MHISTFFGNIFSGLIDLIFPPGEVEKMSPSEMLSYGALLDKETENGVTALLDYRKPLIRKAIWQVKYRGNRKIAKLFGTLLAEELTEELSDLNLFESASRPFLIPIASSSKRLRERGFNQAELIAKNILENLGKNSAKLETDILYRTKEVPSQTSMKKRAARQKNVIGSFGVRSPEKISGKTIFLIDDVSTTGATLLEAKKVLLKAGAKRVFCYSVAH